MNYEVVRNKESRHRWKDHSRRVWYYIHLKEAEKMQIDLTKVFADIGNEKENNGSDLNSNGRILLLQDKKEQLSSSETVLVYIPCRDTEGNFGYVRILKRKKRKVIWFFLLFLLLLLIGGGTWWLLNRKPKVDLDESAISYQMPNGMKNENSSEIMIPVFSSLVMKSGEYPIIINIKTGSLKDPEVEMNGGEVDAVLQVE